MIANFNHNHQKIFGASWKAVVLAFPVVWGKKVGRGDTTDRRTYPCTQVHVFLLAPSACRVRSPAFTYRKFFASFRRV
jgi:hypothetical protein